MVAYQLATGRDFVRTGAKGHAPLLGNKTKVFVARLEEGNRIAPTQQLLTVATGGGDTTTITVTETISTPIVKGQYLDFEDVTTGEEFLVKVAETVSSGSTITIETAIDGGLPDGAKSNFPPLLWDRTDASYDPSFTEQVAKTFNTGGFEDGVSTGGAATMNLPGLFYGKNAAYLTALQAAYDGAEIYVQRQTGDRITEGPCGVTGAPSPSPADGFVGGDLTVKFRGQPTETLSSAG